MKENNQNVYTVPAQLKGSQMDVVEKREAKSEQEADALFNKACKRLLMVNEWGRFAGVSTFRLLDAHGINVAREAQENDYIRIDIPGPGTFTGKGYDWVKIEQIVTQSESNLQLLSMTVRPCSHPQSARAETAHFLKDQATSTFIVSKVGLIISAEEHGRNEMPNVTDGKLMDRCRNFVVGMAAKLGLSYPQWKSLVKGLLAA